MPRGEDESIGLAPMRSRSRNNDHEVVMMSADELEKLLEKTDPHLVMTAMDNRALQQERGWTLSDWTYRKAPGSICFWHADGDGQPTEVVVVVHAARERRAHIERLVADFPVPAKLVLLG